VPIDLNLTCMSKMSALIEVNQRLASERRAFMSNVHDFIRVNRASIREMNVFISDSKPPIDSRPRL
jgi:hypothetical protein